MLQMTDGFSINAFILVPEGEPIGHIHLLHGMAEQISRYGEFAKFLASKGYVVSGHDHRGHGKTSEMNGKLGYFADNNGFERVVEDAYDTVSSIRKQHPTPRFILLGHSMGSFIARRYIQLHGSEVDLVILVGTGSDPGPTRTLATGLAKLAGKTKGYDVPNHLLNKLAFGSFNKKIDKPATKFDWLSRDQNAVKEYIEDPFCGFVPTSGFFIDLFEGIGTINSADEISKVPKTLPILLASGNDDPVGDYGKGVLKVAKEFDAAGVNDVLVKLFEEGRHEILQELNKKQVFEFISDWIEQK